MDYVEKYVAPIRKSEHHTELILDVTLTIGDETCFDVEELFKYQDIFSEIYKCLSEFGFILRYPKGKENITGYFYEPWHIRYVGKKVAYLIYENDLTLEEYMNISNSKINSF